jgi:solute carrier family 35 protein C2
MSIAGIAKEVSTITVSAWFFGDELTPLNIIGVGITVCGPFRSDMNAALLTASVGIALFTFHKYRNSIDGKLSVDAHGNMITIEDGDTSGSVHGADFELSAANLARREDGHLVVCCGETF